MMKISRNKIAFGELKGGDTFLSSDRSNAPLCMKFKNAESINHNCIRLDDGATFALPDTELVIKVEAEVKY
jgi:hypothetical protein